MPRRILRRIVEDMRAFREPLKMLQFIGWGEPIMNPHLAETVTYARELGIANDIELATNAALLTPELSERLVVSGLGLLRVSIQGLDTASYAEACRTDVTFEKIVENVRIFYERRRDCRLYVKIMDVACGDADGVRRFHEIFDPIADAAVVEHYVPFFETRDHYERIAPLTRTGDPEIPFAICPFPFYTLYVWPSGKVGPCSSCSGNPLVLGDLNEETLYNIWSGSRRAELLHHQISNRNEIPECRDCRIPTLESRPQDRLDAAREKLLPLFPRPPAAAHS